MIMISIVYGVTCVLMIVLSFPMIDGKVKPNHWDGLRTRATLENPGIWIPANAYAGKWLRVAGIVTTLASVLIPILTNLEVVAISLLISVIMIGSILVSFRLSNRYAISLLEAE